MVITSSNVFQTPIPIGTKVWISIPGLHDKLHPKNRGPYTIIGITNNDYYIVEDALKRKIEDTFPRQRLKINTNPTNPSQSDVYENFSEKHNSWEPKENFVDNKPIEDYWKSKKGKEPRVKKKRGRPKKINFNIANLVNILTIFLTVLILPIGCNGVDRHYNYKETQKAVKNNKEVTFKNPNYSFGICSIDREFDKLSFSNNKLLFINDDLYEPKINITRRVRFNSRYKKKAQDIEGVIGYRKRNRNIEGLCDWSQVDGKNFEPTWELLDNIFPENEQSWDMQKNKFIGLNEDFEPIFEGSKGGTFFTKNKNHKKYFKTDKKTVTTEVTIAKDLKNESVEEENNTEEIYCLIYPLDNHENTNISEAKSYTEEMINFTYDLSTIIENESNQFEETTDDELIPQNKFGINYSCPANFRNEAFATGDKDKQNISLANIRKMSSQHQIQSNPFGFLLISDIQPKLWALIKEKDPIWYFDATGSIIAKLPNQKETLLFSIVANDSKNKTSISVADFLTSSNVTISIHCCLTKILQKFGLYSFFEKPRVVVTDFSWANLHALCKSFNNLEIIDYLNLTYQILVERKIYAIGTINTVIYLCSTHFLKNMIDETERVLKYHDPVQRGNIKRKFIKAFLLLQNSICLDEFGIILKSIKCVFTSKLKDKNYIESLARLEIFYSSMNANWIKTNTLYLKPESSRNHSKIFFVENRYINFTRDSPFTKYFEEILLDPMDDNSVIHDLEYIFL
ncbi:unnamed protein product [Brachionus calyciflorus]|uniref:Uncharacterized protein n=1 Tax=Brachionus calyciflorus TaxID=104777 RepID=A0A814H8S8_9BILA|nr:unnamed protein product [Brachionus calyciflorus]